VVRDGDFLAVAAPDHLKATNAAKAIRAEWKAEKQTSSAQLFAHLKKHRQPPQSMNKIGSIEDGLAARISA